MVSAQKLGLQFYLALAKLTFWEERMLIEPHDSITVISHVLIAASSHFQYCFRRYKNSNRRASFVYLGLGSVAAVYIGHKPSTER